jgi:hypothetical protein
MSLLFNARLGVGRGMLPSGFKPISSFQTVPPNMRQQADGARYARPRG